MCKLPYELSASGIIEFKFDLLMPVVLNAFPKLAIVLAIPLVFRPRAYLLIDPAIPA